MIPTPTGERIQLLDVLRGFAIFGMFAVNMTWDLRGGQIYLPEPLGFADQTVMLFIALLANSKFVTIFSFLFGLGFYLQFERARTRGANFAALFSRRSADLLLIACVAMACGLAVWILILYVIFGLVLLFLCKRSRRVLLISAILCFVLANLGWRVKKIYGASPDSATPASANEAASAEKTRLDEMGRAFEEGTFADIAVASLAGMAVLLAGGGVEWVELNHLGLLVLGFYVGRLGVLEDAAVRRRFVRSAFPWLLGIPVAGTVIFMALKSYATVGSDSLALASIEGLVDWSIYQVLGLSYAAGITLLFERDACKRVLSLLAPAGRLALTNYLLTSVVAAVVIYSWGFGLYGRLRPTMGALIVVTLFPLLVLASAWWTRRFQFGPVEWCWRAMTYGVIPPMRVGTRPRQARP